MVFNITKKVALITGGGSGIGLQYAKELLRNGAKGVTLADNNTEFGNKAVTEIEEEFGPDKAIFVLTDVTDFNQFQDAFESTIQKFNNVDILINNAGILNDAVWEKQIAINLNGTIHGVLLAVEKYFPKYKQDEEAVIVNISSNAGCEGYGHIPVYCATKHAIIGLTKSYGIPDIYEETKIRFVTICPGVTMTPLIIDMSGRNLGERHQRHYEKILKNFPTQQPEYLATEAMKVIKFAPNGTSWMIEGGEPAYEVVVPDYRTMKNNTISKWEIV